MSYSAVLSEGLVFSSLSTRTHHQFIFVKEMRNTMQGYLGGITIIYFKSIKSIYVKYEQVSLTMKKVFLWFLSFEHLNMST